MDLWDKASSSAIAAAASPCRLWLGAEVLLNLPAEYVQSACKWKSKAPHHHR